MNCVLVRYSEIGLKGKNRGSFEKRLVENIRDFLKKRKIPFESVARMEGRIVIRTQDKCDFLKYVFGVHTYSFAIRVKSELDTMKEEAIKQAMFFPENSKFRVTVQRISKDFPIESTELQKMLGSDIQNNKKLGVSLKEFDHELGIDILSKYSYVWSKKINGPGGLPVGIEGKVICLIEDKDSIEAARLVMKRGCGVIFVGKDEKKISALNEYFSGEPTFVKTEEIAKIEDIAAENKAYALVVGQRLKNMLEIQTKLVVLRPLVGN